MLWNHYIRKLFNIGMHRNDKGPVPADAGRSLKIEDHYIII